MSGLFSVAERCVGRGLFLRGRGNHWWHLQVDSESGREGGFGAGEKSSNLGKWLISSREKISAKILKVAVCFDCGRE